MAFLMFICVIMWSLGHLALLFGDLNLDVRMCWLQQNDSSTEGIQQIQMGFLFSSFSVLSLHI